MLVRGSASLPPCALHLPVAEQNASNCAAVISYLVIAKFPPPTPGTTTSFGPGAPLTSSWQVARELLPKVEKLGLHVSTPGWRRARRASVPRLGRAVDAAAVVVEAAEASGITRPDSAAFCGNTFSHSSLAFLVAAGSVLASAVRRDSTVFCASL